MPSNHLSAPELYQACLDACIDGIENFPVDRRNSATLPLPKPKRHTDSSTIIGILPTTSTCFSTGSLLPSPPPSPSRTGCKQAISNPPSPPLAAMQRSRYADMPICSKESSSKHLLDEPLRVPLSALPPMTSASVSQDARSKLAVPSAPNAGKAKPKKSTVKIVGLVEHVPATPPKSAACTPLAPTTPTPKTALSQKENVKSTDEEESLEALFARLTSKAPATPIRSSTNTSVSQLGKQTVSLESQLDAPRIDPLETTELAKVAAKHATSDETDPANPSENREEPLGNMDLELETKYMRKASEYVDALSDTKLGTARFIGVVSKKLHKTYAQDKKIGQDDVDAIKARFAFAVTTYLNKVLGKGPKACTTDFIEETLQEVQGDFLKLCAKLVEDRYISLDNLDDVAGLAKAMLNILPIGEPGSHTITVANATPQKEPPCSPTTPETMKNPKATMENVGAWPPQEKRETPPAHRTCILKGVAAVTSIHQLQALVWGGKLESISMPEPGSSNALVKFLTAEACERYHKNTANGIVIKGDLQNAVVFVELTEGPNSANDVIQSCIEGGVSRCVRAIGEVELNDEQLTKLAQGKDQVKKREVDCIKRGKNTRGYAYIEFRFANIYNALSFRREITNDDDWEHCNIGYAPDPCEVATGLHYDD